MIHIVCLVSWHIGDVAHLLVRTVVSVLIYIVSTGETISEVVVLLNGVGVWLSITTRVLLFVLQWHVGATSVAASLAIQRLLVTIIVTSLAVRALAL